MSLGSSMCWLLNDRAIIWLSSSCWPPKSWSNCKGISSARWPSFFRPQVLWMIDLPPASTSLLLWIHSWNFWCSPGRCVSACATSTAWNIPKGLGELLLLEANAIFYCSLETMIDSNRLQAIWLVNMALTWFFRTEINLKFKKYSTEYFSEEKTMFSRKMQSVLIAHALYVVLREKVSLFAKLW